MDVYLRNIGINVKLIKKVHASKHGFFKYSQLPPCSGVQPDYSGTTCVQFLDEVNITSSRLKKYLNPHFTVSNPCSRSFSQCWKVSTYRIFTRTTRTRSRDPLYFVYEMSPLLLQLHFQAVLFCRRDPFGSHLILLNPGNGEITWLR